MRTKSGFDFALAFLVGSGTVLNDTIIVDESTCIKNPKAQQTKAVMKLAKQAERRWILNGTPITQGPLDLYSQCKFLDANSITLSYNDIIQTCVCYRNYNDYG